MPAARNSVPGACDPVTLEIVRGAVRAAQAEMEALIERTAISAFIREKKDFYTAVFDADGVMAVGSNLPVFGDICSPVFRDFPPETMREGDVYWYNDCYGSRGADPRIPTTRRAAGADMFHARQALRRSSWAGRITPTSAACAPARSAPTPRTSSRKASSMPPTKLVDAGGLTNEATLEDILPQLALPRAGMSKRDAGH